MNSLRRPLRELRSQFARLNDRTLEVRRNLFELGLLRGNDLLTFFQGNGGLFERVLEFLNVRSGIFAYGFRNAQFGFERANPGITWILLLRSPFRGRAADNSGQNATQQKSASNGEN